MLANMLLTSEKMLQVGNYEVKFMNFDSLLNTESDSIFLISGAIFCSRIVFSMGNHISQRIIFNKSFFVCIKFVKTPMHSWQAMFHKD
jgi:hypothetical protein